MAKTRFLLNASCDALVNQAQTCSNLAFFDKRLCLLSCLEE